MTEIPYPGYARPKMPANPPTPDERDRAAVSTLIGSLALYKAGVRRINDCDFHADMDRILTGLAAARAEGVAEGRVKGLEEACADMCAECAEGMTIDCWIRGVAYHDVALPCAASTLRAAIYAAREGGEGR